MKMIDELKQVLLDEQEALLSGDYEKLPALADRKAILVQKLKAIPPKEAKGGIAELGALVQRNEMLLIAAGDGFHAGLGQVRQLTRPPQQSTYAPDGRRRVLSRQPGAVEKKS